MDSNQNKTQSDADRFHTLMPKSRKLLVILGLFLVLIIFPFLAYSYYGSAVSRPSQTADEVTIDISGGASVAEIAAMLYERDAINSEFLFKMYIVLNNLENSIQAGVYTIPAGTSISELAAILQHGTDDQSITFLEGWRVEEFAKHASDNFSNIDYKDFLTKAATEEGYLFPDTYFFNSEIREEDMIDKLRSTFESKTEKVLSEENLANASLTRQQAVIFASIVEREVNTEADRPIVAGILIKRWREGEKLGADATTQYAIAAGRYGCDLGINEPVICPDEEEIPNVEWWPDDLTVAELENESEFNTRQVVGLPPHPIANPGLGSLEAVINYEETDYYYYLTDESGVTHYAETLEGHNNNITLYLN